MFAVSAVIGAAAFFVALKKMQDKPYGGKNGDRHMDMTGMALYMGFMILVMYGLSDSFRLVSDLSCWQPASS